MYSHKVLMIWICIDENERASAPDPLSDGDQSDGQLSSVLTTDSDNDDDGDMPLFIVKCNTGKYNGYEVLHPTVDTMT